MRGIRIELEALEQAITALPTVKHCEARVIDDRLVLLVSGEESSEANLKSTAAALGRGYVLSQVKFVDVDAWKFNTSGKLLRNVVPFEAPVAQRDAWEAFDKSTASDLEQEIAQCIAPQVSDLDRWSVNSHFMEDLGIDSGGFGRLISRMRQGKGKLCQVNLQMLFEYPTMPELTLRRSTPWPLTSIPWPSPTLTTPWFPTQQTVPVAPWRPRFWRRWKRIRTAWHGKMDVNPGRICRSIVWPSVTSA